MDHTAYDRYDFFDIWKTMVINPMQRTD